MGCTGPLAYRLGDCIGTLGPREGPCPRTPDRHRRVGTLTEAVANASIAIPLPQIQVLLAGLPRVAPYLVTAIPLAIYLFLESLNNVESAMAGGDTYDTREAMLAAAGGTAVASLFGSPFPTLIYIGHPGWKSVGSRVGYSWLTGVTMFLLGVLGLLGILSAIIPVVAILPILVYIGMLITSQAFNASPKRHARAVAIAIIPVKKPGSYLREQSW